MSDIFLKLLIFAITFCLTVGANLALTKPQWMRIVQGAILGLNGFFLLILAGNFIEWGRHWHTTLGMLIWLGMLVGATLLLFETIRRRLAPLFTPNYDPASPVHMVAMILGVYFFGLQFASFALNDGLTGVALNIELAWGGLIADAIPQWIIPLVGVGWLVRRSWAETRVRLGLVGFNSESIQMGVMTSIALFFGVAVFTFLWRSLISAEEYATQTQATEALVGSVNTIGLVVAFALATAVGEELVFRGALQPIFGLWVTTLGFVLIHVQYTLTPAMLIIFGVGLVLAWVRERSNLYTVIIAHFLYNLIGLSLALR